MIKLAESAYPPNTDPQDKIDEELDSPDDSDSANTDTKEFHPINSDYQIRYEARIPAGSIDYTFRSKVPKLE